MYRAWGMRYGVEVSDPCIGVEVGDGVGVSDPCIGVEIWS